MSDYQILSLVFTVMGTITTILITWISHDKKKK